MKDVNNIPIEMGAQLNRLTDLRRKINGQSYVTPGENALADDLMTLCEIMSNVATNSQRMANRLARDLANGPLPG